MRWLSDKYLNVPFQELVGCTICEVERELILETLRCYAGSRTESAKILGISIRTIRNKIREYEQLGITVPAVGSGAVGEIRTELVEKHQCS